MQNFTRIRTHVPSRRKHRVFNHWTVGQSTEFDLVCSETEKQDMPQLELPGKAGKRPRNIYIGPTSTCRWEGNWKMMKLSIEE